jgi:cytidylate kinase
MELANALASRLGCPCVSREILLESARRYNIEPEILEGDMYRAPKLLQRLTRDRHRYLVFVRCSLLQAARQGSLVYHGHAGQVFLEGIRHVLRVRIVAPLEQRAEVLATELGLPREEAIAEIKRSDSERRRWVSFLYQRDWEDPALYDLTVNLAGMNLDTACDILLNAANHPSFQPTQESLQRLEDLSLECEVMAGLAADDELWNQPLQVSASRGDVLVRGEVENPEQRALVEQIVPMVKGVTSYQMAVTARSNPLGPGVPWRD